MKTKVLLLLLLALSVSACGPATVKSHDESSVVVTAEKPELIPTQTEQSVATSWKVVRDARYGFGLAVPCWWQVSPIPVEGIGGVMTIKNYDEDYFNAHSNKGFWDWPNGALKLDVVVMEGVDPAKADAEAYMQFVDSNMTGLVSAKTQQVGAHTATVLTLSNMVNRNDPNTRMFIYRLAPDKLILVAPTPQSVIDTPDFQALLASIVLTPDEQIILPTIAPAPALINATCG